MVPELDNIHINQPLKPQQLALEYTGHLPVKPERHLNDARGIFSWLLSCLWSLGQEVSSPSIEFPNGLLVEGAKAKGFTVEKEVEQDRNFNRTESSVLQESKKLLYHISQNPTRERHQNTLFTHPAGICPNSKIEDKFEPLSVNTRGRLG